MTTLTDDTLPSCWALNEAYTPSPRPSDGSADAQATGHVEY